MKHQVGNQPENKVDELMEDAPKDDIIKAAPESEDPIESPDGAAEGQVLARIDRKPFELAVRSARAA